MDCPTLSKSNQVVFYLELLLKEHQPLVFQPNNGGKVNELNYQSNQWIQSQKSWKANEAKNKVCVSQSALRRFASAPACSIS
jgi:hypothetical protein